VHTITPISTATNTPGKPIYVRRPPSALAITPDGKTLYVGSQFAVSPISAATNKVGRPIHIGGGVLETAITPDGKTLYVASDDEGSPGTVTPVSTATNTAGKPIHVGAPVPIGGAPVEIALTPDGRTLYGAALNKVVPISTATNTPGPPIRPVSSGYPREIVITP
jgi:hyaluronoglucosaminidase